ncbi:hypothetical protein FSW04_25230 [Baekduia soli]|uniref:Glyoxalase/fosfomycin resistance/dioxygenase domain-containing protein n=1 Tax=Baekduia soli TaxID=496014 RepID=A0A5B8UD17_9ACTN|nr:VOC family protein [Baekduia soli]QEC50562.1 hypothetical protein FSW04_25230 [Baekduia soli]
MPAIRRAPVDRTAADHGWAGFAVAVPDFDETLGRLRAAGATITEPLRHDGLRRVAFRDPDLALVVEILEEGAATPGGIRPRHYPLAPAIVSVTLSVGDLERARASLAGVVGLVPVERELHTPALEHRRGLDDVRREAFGFAPQPALLRPAAWPAPAVPPGGAPHRSAA